MKILKNLLNSEINNFFNINRVRAYGPGIEPVGPVVGAPANFTVETFSAGKGINAAGQNDVLNL